MNDCVDFGIIPNIEYGKDYSLIGDPSEYEALYAQYRCVSVSDDIVDTWIPLTDNMPTYLCSLSRANKGIDHYGVTIIPPTSVKMLLDIVRLCMDTTLNESVEELVKLLNVAAENSQHIICYGI
ncbi:MAG: hypothetical protein IJU78_08575 [Clostridia bacterium]|nr:hypothetical protein [Clostridia bacterium]